MTSIIFFTTMLFFTLFSNANQYSLVCSLQGIQEKTSIDLGTIKKSIDTKYDFDMKFPKSPIKKWSALTETTKISGSTETPKQGWVGLAFTSELKPNDGWACIKLVKGQEVILTRTSNEQLTLQARCVVE